MNKSMKKFIPHYLLIQILVLFTGGAFSSANAATYHVRKDGNDTTCNGSANAPSTSAPNCAFLTVQNGLKMAQAGDTVSVHAGDYSSAKINSVRTGTASARITISGAGDGTSTVGRTNILNGHNYITMSGLNFAGFCGGSPGQPCGAEIEVNGAYFTYTNNHMQPTNANSYGNALGIRANGANMTVSNSVFEAGTAVGGPSFYSVILLNSVTQNALIDRNIIRNMIDVERVFEVYGNNHTYRNNEIYNLKFSGDDVLAHPDIWQNWGNNTVTNFLAENNYIHDFEGQIGNIEGDNPRASGPWVFRNNVFANIDSCMFIHTWKFYWYNNTFFNVSKSCPHPIYAGYTGGDSLDVKNNVFVESGTGSGNGWYAYQSGTANYNFVSTLTNGKKNGFSEANGINGGNPMFVNAKTDCVQNVCDFHIAANSVLINKGTPIANVSADGSPIPSSSVDKDGNPRTGTWDIGAYEFGSSGTISTPTLLSPSNLRVTP